MFKRLFCSIILILSYMMPLQLQAESIPHSRLVTTPTAGSLPAKTYILDTRLYDNGGMVHMFGFGLTDLVDIGISYGGSNIIGSSKISWQSHVAAQVHIRIVEETLKTPAFSIGFDSQGEGPFLKGDGMNRFRIKSRGVYAVVSRNYSFLGDLGFHGGVNYSFETDDGDSDPSFWLGMNKSVLKSVELCGEYDFATNDNEKGSMNVKHGYLNASFKWNFGEAFTLEFDLKNILRNEKRDITGVKVEKPEPSRELRFFYRKRF